MRFIFFVFVILFSLNLKANALDPTAMNDILTEATSYDTGRQLCYAYTYYRAEGRNPMVDHPTATIDSDDQVLFIDADGFVYNSFVNDEKYRAGMMQWLVIRNKTFRSALLTADQTTNENSQHEEWWHGRSKYVKTLIETEGFENAIIDCADAHNVNADQLLENIKRDISNNDIFATLGGRFAQEAAIGKGLGVVFRGIKLLKHGVTWLARWSRNARAYRWLMSTKVVRALKTRMQLLWNQDRILQARNSFSRIRWREVGAGVATSTAILGLSAIKLKFVDSPYLQVIEEKRAARRQGEELTKNGLEIDGNQKFWSARYSAYKELIESLNVATTGSTYNMSRESYTERLYRCDPVFKELRKFCTYINVYVVDYYIVQKALEHFRQDWFTQEISEEIFTLEVMEQMFHLRKLVLEREATSGDQRAQLTLRLMEESRNDPSLKCDFNDKTSLTLCRLHYLYIIKDVNGRLTPQQATQLEQLESMYLSS